MSPKPEGDHPNPWGCSPIPGIPPKHEECPPNPQRCSPNLGMSPKPLGYPPKSGTISQTRQCVPPNPGPFPNPRGVPQTRSVPHSPLQDFQQDLVTDRRQLRGENIAERGCANGAVPLFGARLFGAGDAGRVWGWGRSSPAEGRTKPRSTRGRHRGASRGCRAAAGTAVSPGKDPAPPVPCLAPQFPPFPARRSPSCPQSRPAPTPSPSPWCRPGPAAPDPLRGDFEGSPNPFPPQIPPWFPPYSEQGVPKSTPSPNARCPRPVGSRMVPKYTLHPKLPVSHPVVSRGIPKSAPTPNSRCPTV